MIDPTPNTGSHPTENPPLTSVRSGTYLVCVDKRPESRVALRLACIKAQKRGGAVNILHVVPPSDFQTLSSISEKIREEQRAEASVLLDQLAGEAYDSSGVNVRKLLREGPIGEEILAAAQEDFNVNMLVLGVAPGSGNHGKLLAWLTAQLGGKLLVPLMLVPGNLTDQQLDELS